MSKVKRKIGTTPPGLRIVIEGVLLFFVLLVNVPFFWMISTSFKLGPEILAYPPRMFPSKLNFDGYKYIWTLVPFARYFLNTLFVSFSISVSKIILASFAAYAFAKIPFKGKNTIFFIFLGTMMIPMEVIIIPNYITLNLIGWLDTYWALIIPFVVGAFSIFLLRQFFMQIPQDLDDAAVIDGCGRTRYLLTIVYPLSKPALLTVGLYAFLASWNSFLWPLIVTNSDNMRVIQIALKALQDSWMIDWTSLTAASTIATVPIIVLFFFVQKQFLEGIAITGLKG
ncbi:MAG: carbohydrate ABC transporter permease [Spirochaetaceae bacterium]|nr:carbohydrate ABC transporter permease [Spirochaetaceae bacterium]